MIVNYTNTSQVVTSVSDSTCQYVLGITSNYSAALFDINKSLFERLTNSNSDQKDDKISTGKWLKANLTRFVKTGDTGTRGIQGIKGSQGIQQIGAQGYRGNRGMDGNPGEGSQGIQGIQGYKGKSTLGIQGVAGESSVIPNSILLDRLAAKGIQVTTGAIKCIYFTKQVQFLQSLSATFFNKAQASQSQ